jgi:ribose 5-phosphate isomerase B
MKLSVGSDECKHVVSSVLKWLKKQGHQVVYYGPANEGSIPWTEVAQLVANDVASGAADEGILFCWTGTGVCMVANKVRGVRAALCMDAETARGARLWNNANILCLSIRLTTETIAQEILKSWFETQYQLNPTDDACLQELHRLEEDNFKPGI